MWWAVAAATGAFGCQAILGIDDTSFHDSSAETDGSASDGGISEAGPANDSGASDGGHVDVDAGSALLSISPGRVVVHEGETVDLTATVTRTGYTGAVVVSFTSLADAGLDADGGANGVSAPTLTIGPGQTTGIIHLSASATAAVGITSASFTVRTDATATVAVPLLVAGAPGTFDTTFGTGGAVADYPGQSYRQIVIDENDSPWVMGNGGWIVRHYDTNGVVDTATNAAVATTMADLDGNMSHLAVRAGVLVVGGTESSEGLAVRKMTTAGALFATFGGGGTFHAQVSSNPNANGSVNGLAIASNGDVFASAYMTSTQTFGAVYRIHGSTSTSYRYTAESVPAGLAIGPTGQVASGGTFTTADGGTMLFASAFDDALDASTAFNGSPARNYIANDLGLGADGQIIIAATEGYHIEGALGVFDGADASPIAFYDYSHFGTWDTGFTSVLARSNGNVLVSGAAGGSQTRFAFVRAYQPDGGIDPSYSFSISSSGGKPDATFYDLATDSWGRVYVVGDIYTVGAYMTRLWP